MTAEASGDHRFGAALHTDGTLIALGTVRRHTEAPDVATIGYSVLPPFWRQGLGCRGGGCLRSRLARRGAPRDARGPSPCYGTSSRWRAVAVTSR
jgi:hypothetical protein